MGVAMRLSSGSTLPCDTEQMIATAAMMSRSRPYEQPEVVSMAVYFNWDNGVPEFSGNPNPKTEAFIYYLHETS